MPEMPLGPWTMILDGMAVAAVVGDKVVVVTRKGSKYTAEVIVPDDPPRSGRHHEWTAE